VSNPFDRFHEAGFDGVWIPHIDDSRVECVCPEFVASLLETSQLASESDDAGPFSNEPTSRGKPNS
jgi:hypothetical protein